MKKTYDERIAELEEKKEKEIQKLEQLKAKKKKLEQQQKALERKARTKRLIETGAIIESVLGRPLEKDEIEDIKKIIACYRLKKEKGEI